MGNFFSLPESPAPDTTPAIIGITDKLQMPNCIEQIPRLGYGVYNSTSSRCVALCAAALEAGYRHIDTVQNELEVGVGRAVRQSGLQRADVFIATKILVAGGSFAASVQKCLDSVEKIDGKDGYVDCFLIHSPNGGKETREEIWQALEKLYEMGRAKSIGVSNFGVGHIEEMRNYATVWPPHVNQIQLHPWCQQKEVVKYCEKNDIVVEAYCPLVGNQKAEDPTLVEIAKKHNVSTSQILVRYCLQKGWVALPQSDDPEQITQNADVYDFNISPQDMATLDGLDEGASGAIVERLRAGSELTYPTRRYSRVSALSIRTTEEETASA